MDVARQNSDPAPEAVVCICNTPAVSGLAGYAGCVTTEAEPGARAGGGGGSAG